ncbi:MAG: branched-chain amino acid ABC transporter permease, partial [Acidimicrobiia bacterium]|nr:branched-chain amino acid ABC transporter permease [Acidimicrobiia bacterium]
SRLLRLARWAVVGAFLIALPALVDQLALRQYASLMVLALGVLGVVVATGQAGLISLGHGAFVGLGAFTMGWFLDHRGWPFVLAVIGTFAVCSAAGWLLGLPALRIKGIYLALVTLGVAVVFPSLAKRFPAVTGGTTGRAIDARMEPPAWTGLGADQAVTWRYWFCLLVCALAFLGTRNVMDGRMGRAMQAVRDDEAAAATFGINLIRAKAGAFGLSAGLAGMAGALQVVLFPFVSHEQFTVFLSFRLYAAAVLGGVIHLVGAVYGVLALIAVPTLNEGLGAVAGRDEGLLRNDVIVFGIGLIALTFVSNDGLAGVVERIRHRVATRYDRSID